MIKIDTITTINNANKGKGTIKEILLDKRRIYYFKSENDSEIIMIVELLPWPVDDRIEKKRIFETFYLKENKNILNDIIAKNIFKLITIYWWT